MKELGHNVIGVDTSPSLIAAARGLDPSSDIRLADAAALPFDDASADLAIALMSLHDISAMPAAVREAARVLEPSGRFCVTIVHPINSAGRFEATADDAPVPFVIEGAYLGTFNYSDAVERDGLSMTFHSQHRPIESYFLALEEAGLPCGNRGFMIAWSKQTAVADGSGCPCSCTCAPVAHERQGLGLQWVTSTLAACCTGKGQVPL